MLKKLWILGACLSVVLFASNAFAGAKIKINDDAQINLGFRLQTLYLHHDKDLDGDGDFEDNDDFKIRRARLRLGADINKYIGIFLQTEFSQDSAAGGDVRLIDAFVKLKPHKLANFVIGDNLSQNHYDSLLSLIRDRIPRTRSKGCVYLSPLEGGDVSRLRLFEFYRLKRLSRLPLFLYLIQRL